MVGEVIGEKGGVDEEGGVEAFEMVGYGDGLDRWGQIDSFQYIDSSV